MFFGWFDAIFSFIFPILFLLFMGMFFFALISNLAHGIKTTTRRGLPFRQRWWQSVPMFRIPVVPMPEMCPVRTDTTPARSRHTM